MPPALRALCEDCRNNTFPPPLRPPCRKKWGECSLSSCAACGHHHREEEGACRSPVCECPVQLQHLEDEPAPGDEPEPVEAAPEADAPATGEAAPKKRKRKKSAK
jgi:hypothetical protein